MSGIFTKREGTGKNFCLETRTIFPVSYHFADHVLFAEGLSQKKHVIPDHQIPIKSVKSAFCVDQLSSAHNVTNVPTVVSNLPVGSRLQNFWEKWAALNLNPKVVSVLREGYPSGPDLI